MYCEICGSYSEKLYQIEIEGTNLMACEKCKNTGKLLDKTTDIKERQIERIQKPLSVKHLRQPKYDIQDFDLAEDYGLRISKARQRLGLTIKELAEKVFEKESVLHKIESGKMIPDQKLKERLEKFLNIKLEEKDV